MASIVLETKLRKAKTLAKKSRIDEAIKLYEEILQKYPKNQRAFDAKQSLMQEKQVVAGTVNNDTVISKMYNLYHSGKFLDVIEIGIGLADDTSLSAEVWNLIGASNKQLGRLNCAVNAFKKAAELDDQNANFLNNLGVSLNATGNYEEALTVLEKAISVDESYAEAHFNIANILKEQDKLQEASRGLSGSNKKPT